MAVPLRPKPEGVDGASSDFTLRGRVRWIGAGPIIASVTAIAPVVPEAAPVWASVPRWARLPLALSPIGGPPAFWTGLGWLTTARIPGFPTLAALGAGCV